MAADHRSTWSSDAVSTLPTRSFLAGRQERRHRQRAPASQTRGKLDARRQLLRRIWLVERGRLWGNVRRNALPRDGSRSATYIPTGNVSVGSVKGFVHVDAPE